MTTISNIDLHCHTTASDGSLSPTAIVARAYGRGLNVLAITDHDLVAGVEEGIRAAEKCNALLLAHAPDAPREHYLKDTAEVLSVDNGVLDRPDEERLLTVIPGVEFSTTWNDEQIHVAGLFMDINHPRLQQLVQSRRVARTERALAIAAKLERLGFERPYERCVAAAQEGATITRGNYARLIFADGKAKSVDDAFHQYLRRGQPAYVQTKWGPIDEVIEVVTEAGGVAVLAHPRRYNFSNQRLRRLINDFKSWGGQAMEVSSAQQKPTDRDYVANLCQQYELLASLGSDFHSEGMYRDLGQNLDLPAHLTPVWTCEAAAKFGLSGDFKQRLVHVTYHKEESPAPQQAATAAQFGAISSTSHQASSTPAKALGRPGSIVHL